MAKIAIIKTGGKQYIVKEGENIKIEKLVGKIGEEIQFDTLLTADLSGDNLKIGQPSLGKKVLAKIIGHGKDKKVKVVKYKAKTRYLRKLGHRQLFTKAQIEKIE